jgi:ferric-dicitrate binding protein FerR (iron transport regulator)
VSASAKAPLNEQVLEEAAGWFIEFRAGTLTGAAREEFLEWLRRSPEHIRAYLEISEAYVRLPTSDAMSAQETERLIAQIDARITDGVVRLSERVPRAPPAAGPANSLSARSTSWRTFSLAASVLILVGGAVAVYVWSQRGLYTTGAGEERTVTLSDASRVQLNARTRLRVTYTDHTRDIQFLDGQALFQVAKDKTRPFIVHAGATSVRAVGTEFDVNRRSTGTTITVLEGRVAVVTAAAAARGTSPQSMFGSSDPSLNPTSASGDAPDPTTSAPSTSPRTNAASQHALPQAPPRDSSSGSHPGDSSYSAARTPDSDLTDPAGSAAIFLFAGEQVTVGQAGTTAVAQPHAANVSAATAWTRGQLEFQETPLADVADEFNRASTGRRLVVDDPKLRALQISGVYVSSDPDSLVRFLREQPGVQVVEEGSEIRIEAR